MYDAGYTRDFYDAYGNLEWDRLEATAYGRLQATIHNDFIRRYVRDGDRVLDAGCGPGRFTATIAELGAAVTALDLSDRQLQLAEENIREKVLLGRVEDFVAGDITDLSLFPDGSFDVVVCYGGALSYVCEERERAASELAGSNVTAFEGSTTLDEVLGDRNAWSTIVRIERELNRRPGLVDTGSHMIMASQRLGDA